MNAGKAVYGILSGTTAVTDIVGTRIFPEIAEQEAVTPFIIYQLQSVAPEDTHDGPSKLDEVRFEFLCYADTYNGAADLATALRGALDRVSGTYNGVNVESVQFNDVDVEIEYDPRRYSQVLKFTFRIKRDDIEIALGTPVTGAQLGDLSDVNVDGVTDNQILSYDAATDTWVPAADAGGAEELDDLSDVKIVGTPSDGDALVYSSGFWSRGTAGATTLSELDDVSDLAPSGSQVLTWSGSEWQPAALPSPPPTVDELNDLTDVTITTPATNQILRFTGSVFSNQDLTQYYNRYATEAAALRSGATATVELYYTAQADGDGYAESAESDTATTGFDIRRKLYYAESAQSNPDTGTWVQFADIADNTTFANAKTALLAYLKERTGGTVPISLKMTWEEVAQAPSFTGLLNESYGSGAEAAYSTRRLNGNVTDCMVIRRASDSTTTTIGFDGSGNIDEAAIETFCTGTTCTVYQWLDQSGNGNDATAAAPANEPTIYTGGALVKEGGKVAVEFDGASNFFESGAVTTSSQPVTVISTTTPQATAFSGGIINTTDSNNFLDFYRNDGGFAINAGTTLTSGASVDYVQDNQYLRFSLFNGASSEIFANGASVISGNANTTGLAGNLFIGKFLTSSDNYMNGLMQEVLLYASNKSSVRTSIESNIADYFTQNTPLLDTYSGAAAAYSLRLLDSTYTGSAVEVYNGSSYADIGFNVFGELDTVALAAHCGSNDGFVSKWYSQTGSNHATQTTTANMPKIYDGTTGVVTENGKPAVEFDGLDICDLSNFITPSTVSNYSVAGVARPDSNDKTVLILSDGSENMTWHYGRTAGELSVGTYDGTTVDYASGSSTISTQFLGFSIHDFDVPASTLFLDGSSTSGTESGRGDFDSRIGGGPSGRNFFGAIQEIVVWASDQSSNRTNIEDNINTFYSIY